MAEINKRLEKEVSKLMEKYNYLFNKEEIEKFNKISNENIYELEEILERIKKEKIRYVISQAKLVIKTYYSIFNEKERKEYITLISNPLKDLNNENDWGNDTIEPNLKISYQYYLYYLKKIYKYIFDEEVKDEAPLDTFYSSYLLIEKMVYAINNNQKLLKKDYNYCLISCYPSPYEEYLYNLIDEIKK